MLSTLNSFKENKMEARRKSMCCYIKIDLESTEGLLSFEGL